VTVKNTGSAATKGWKVAWTYGGDQKITSLWNGTLTQSGTSVSVTNAGYNGALQPNGTTSFGFTGTYTGTNTTPTLTCTPS
jgi:cellulase/cellobiase CelA1